MRAAAGRVPPAGRSAVLAGAVLVSAVVLFAPTAAQESGLPGADKVVHVALFGGLAAAGIWRAGRSVVLLALLAAYAAVSEVVQGLLPTGRAADPLDLVADLVGVALAWWAAGAGGRARGRQPG